MKKSEFKQLIKEAVKEAFHEELKDILLESIKSNKQPIIETQQNVITTPSKQNNQTLNPKKKYMDILNEMKQGPKTGLDGEFELKGSIDTISEGSSLPGGQLPLDMITQLIKGKK